MLVLQRFEFGKGPFLTDSAGFQRVLALLKDGLSHYVVFYDSHMNSTYIERVKNVFGNAYESANLEKIESEEEYAMVLAGCVDAGIIKRM